MKEEKALTDHVIQSAKMFHGLTKQQIKELAYSFAKNKGKSIPSSWECNKAAGEDWLKGFRHRGNRISLRQPEATSIARAMGFNPTTVKSFFDNIKQLFAEKGVIPPQNIWNLDETGISTVQKPRHVLAEKGCKQIGRITSAERGTTVTMCACVNAIGNSIPPAFIFPRVFFKQDMLIGAPEQSLGLSTKTGWMNSELFLQVLGHFVKFMKVSKDCPGLLFMDNHGSHVSLDVINLARENGLSIITFPPHCSHKLQPLDVSIYGPFKRFYASYCDSWMTGHPGSSISIHKVCRMAGQAYIRAFTMENIVSSFRATGIYPFNQDIFPQDAFMGSLVTDIPLKHADADTEADLADKREECKECIIALNLPSQPQVNVGASTSSSSDSRMIHEISPHPRVSSGTKRSKRRKISTVILTGTPEQTRIAEYEASKNKRSKKQPAKRRIMQSRQPSPSSSSSENETMISLNSDSETPDDLSCSDQEIEPITVLDEILEPGCYGIVKVHSKENSKNL